MVSSTRNNATASATTATTTNTPAAHTATAAKRARAAKHHRARLLALAAVLDDLAERSCPACAERDDNKCTASDRQTCENPTTPTTSTTTTTSTPTSTTLTKCVCAEQESAIRPVSADTLLARAVGRRAAVSTGAAVCALVYVGRVHACDGLRKGNAGALLVGALALAAAYVDRRNAVAALARAAGLSVAGVITLRDRLVVALKHRTYISPATFREFDAILDDLAR